jgi:hypothetical protein
MSNPVGAAVDANGTLWVADMWSNRVLRFDNAASKANGAAADGVLGQSDFTGATSRTDAQGMQMPLGIGVWGTQWLWVADTGNHRVTLFDLSAQPTATPTLTPSSTPTATQTPGPGTPTATAQPTSTTGPGTPTATAQPTATTVPSGLVPRAYLPWLWVR